jgi:pyruvate,water dikinase
LSQIIHWFEHLGIVDVPRVGGKNASLGEILQTLGTRGIPVPPGFAVSASTYREFIAANGLDQPIAQALDALKHSNASLAETGACIRELILSGEFDAGQDVAIREAYLALCRRTGVSDCDVAVRSSATAEDLPEASFAGQQESYLNVRGGDAVLHACRRCFASLYTDRAIAYREEQGFEHTQVALSVGVQQMIRSDLGSAGVMFTLDTETGFPDVVVISGAWGLGESVVKGTVNPDRFMVYKPFLGNSQLEPLIDHDRGNKLSKRVYDEQQVDLDQCTATIPTTEEERLAPVLDRREILKLARWGATIEKHYGRPMDIEWAKDGRTGELFIVQARPETVESQKDRSLLVQYELRERSTPLLQGASVGNAIASGRTCCLQSPGQSDQFPDGAILVAERTDPDWVPVMRRAAGIITDTGGATSHAAIVSRELKVPAIVGTEDATRQLVDGQPVTLDCTPGLHGTVYEGELDFETRHINISEIPSTHTDIMLNVAMPDGAMRWWQLPVAGIGLTRMEFIIASQIRVHPMALLKPEAIEDQGVLDEISGLTRDYEVPAEYFVDVLAMGIGKIAASQYPKPVIVRMSDFKSNEYRGLLGGEYFEPREENPMLGLRGASRYYHPMYRDAFKLECEAICRVRLKMGFTNVIVMIPFCRSPAEADRVLEVMAEAGLNRGEEGLEVYVMCEIPSNIILADAFSERFDGFSIGSNDLTQLVLGVDRDSSELANQFDARDEAVRRMIAQVIDVAHRNNRKVGICGQAPSDHPEFGAFLVECGIDSISLNPDSVPVAARVISDAER